ncbi:MAG: hypothetical protein GYA24_04270 [Candidatus Lokiarchaeota archaeon]|nr:hypothetical protein [Candidatus Lokiarchaeota archaeon]
MLAARARTPHVHPPGLATRRHASPRWDDNRRDWYRGRARMVRLVVVARAGGEGPRWQF